MGQEDRWYLLERARASLEASRRAGDPSIAAIHRELHERYMALAAQQSGPGASLEVVPRQA